VEIRPHDRLPILLEGWASKDLLVVDAIPRANRRSLHGCRF